MPDLVYNVKFEVDSSSLEKIGNIVDPNASEELKKLQKQVQALQTKLKESSGTTKNSSKQYRDYLESVRTATTEQRKNISELKKDIILKRQNTAAHIQQSSAIEQGAGELEEMGVELRRLASTQNLSEKETQQLNNAFRALAEVQRSGISTTNRFNAGLQVVEHQAGTMNKSFAGSNQILFSFSDLVQDSTQFSQGFAQGMRAIGNNVGFTAELFANLSTNVRRHNELVRKGILQDEEQITTFGALKNSFKGAGGALITINAVVMASTIVFQKLEKRVKKLNDEAKKTVEAFSEVTKEFSDFGSDVEDPFGFQARESEITLLQKKVNTFSDDFKTETVQSIVTGLRTTEGASSILLKGVAELMEKFPEAAFGIASTFGIIDDATIKQAATQDEFRKKLKESKEALEQLNEAVTNVNGLRTFIGLSKEASNSLLVLNANSHAGIKVNDDNFKSRVQLIESVRGQIQATQNFINTGELDAEKRREQLVLLNKQIELFEKLNEPLEKAREQIEEVTFANTKSVSGFEQLNREAEQQKEILDELAEAYPALTAEVDEAKAAIDSFTAANKVSMVAESIAELAALGGTFGEIFNASKEFRIAMATIEGAASIVSVFADPTMTTFAKIAAAATVTASVIKQIQTIKKTKLGSSGNVSSGGGGGSRGSQGIFNTTGGDRATTMNRSLFTGQASAFVPRAQGGAQTLNVNVTNTFDEQTAASVVADGNEQRREGAISAT